MDDSSMHPDVAAVGRLHAELHSRSAEGLSVSEWIEKQAQTLLREHDSGNPDATIQLRNGLPGVAHLDARTLLSRPLSIEESRLAIARDHGFAAAPTPSALEPRLDPDFELCLDDLIAGRLANVRAHLERRPELARERSRFGHGATCLHYLVANGVEIRRQVVSKRAAKAAVILLEAGAEVDATARVYGGEFTARQLLESSAHPERVGVAEDLAHVLNAGGARS